MVINSGFSRVTNRCPLETLLPTNKGVFLIYPPAKALITALLCGGTSIIPLVCTVSAKGFSVSWPTSIFAFSNCAFERWIIPELFSSEFISGVASSVVELLQAAKTKVESNKSDFI